jgi:hypothetical protein
MMMFDLAYNGWHQARRKRRRLHAIVGRFVACA